MPPPPRREGLPSRLSRRLLRSDALAALLGAYLNFCRRTARWELRDAHLLGDLARRPEGFVLAFWHECLPLMPMAWSELWASLDQGTPRKRGLVMVSRSRDGRMIGALLARFGLTAVEGSSSAGGADAARDLLAGMREGAVAVMVPDGPRGPRRAVSRGTLRLAAMAGAPVVPCGAHVSPCLRVGSWDRMVIPLPFARCVAVVGAPIRVGREVARGAGEAAAGGVAGRAGEVGGAALGAALTAALERAVAAAGSGRPAAEGRAGG